MGGLSSESPFITENKAIGRLVGQAVTLILLAIDAFHAAALAAGCPDEGAPGTRDWAPHAYAAYTRDLDGNKLAVYCFKAA